MLPGEVLGGKYVVERVLGRGGMGEVVVARHMLLGELVAIKTLLAGAGGEAGERFLNEARASLRIRSEHVVRVSDVDLLPNGQPYMVMELLDGRDLEARIAEGPFAVEEAVELLLQACEGVAEAHRLGIVHRDLKPANMYLTRRSDGSTRLVLLDFGISKFSSPGAQGLTATHGFMGSPLYMSPEQLQDPRDVDPRSDVWALGVILFRMLSGRTPFVAESLPTLVVKILQEQAPSVRSLRPDVPPLLDALLSRCLQRSREQRMASVAALASALSPFASRDGARAIERLQHMSGALPAAPAIAETRASGPAIAPMTPSASAPSTPSAPALLPPSAPAPLPPSAPAMASSIGDRSLSPMTALAQAEAAPKVGRRLWIGAGVGAAAVLAIVLALVFGGTTASPASPPPSTAKQAVEEPDEPKAEPKMAPRPVPTAPEVEPEALAPTAPAKPASKPTPSPTVAPPPTVAPAPSPSCVNDNI